MDQRYGNEFTMFSTVRDFMGNHTTDTAEVPAIAPVVASLATIISQIDAAGTAQAAPLTGISGGQGCGPHDAGGGGFSRLGGAGGAGGGDQ